MLKILKTLTLVLAAGLLQPVLAADTAADAVAMVDKGVAYLKKNGKDALIKEVNNKNPDFIRGELYLYVYSLDGTTIAHPTNPKLIGKNLVVLPDPDGKFFRKEIIEGAASKGKGWVDYRYNNPTTKDIEKKTAYFVKADDVILVAGIYKGK